MGGHVQAVLTCAFLAAVYLCRETERTHHGDLTPWFRARALITGTMAGAVALAGIPVLAVDAPSLFEGLTGRAAPLIGVFAASGTAALCLLWRRRYVIARLAAAVAVAAVVWGWALGQYPWLLVGELTVGDGAGSRATLAAMAWSLVSGRSSSLNGNPHGSPGRARAHRSPVASVLPSWRSGVGQPSSPSRCGASREPCR